MFADFEKTICQFQNPIRAEYVVLLPEWMDTLVTVKIWQVTWVFCLFLNVETISGDSPFLFCENQKIY